METQTEHKSEISNIPIKGVGHGKGEFWERIDSSLPLNEACCGVCMVPYLMLLMAR